MKWWQLKGKLWRIYYWREAKKNEMTFIEWMNAPQENHEKVT
jgi:hypothetical protein